MESGSHICYRSFWCSPPVLVCRKLLCDHYLVFPCVGPSPWCYHWNCWCLLLGSPLGCYCLPSCWFFLSTLSSAHWGYLYWVSALLRYCNSLVRSSGPVQTTFALWVRGLITLYLAARLWWLSHCKYWSVCMGFLYTVIDEELAASGLTKVSRKGIVPFPWLPLYC